MDENTSNWSRERVLKYIYHGLCGFAALGFTIFCVHLYVLDEDVAQIEFKEFNRDNEHIYPTVTLCFRHPLLGEKLLKFGEGINVSTYTSFLIGDLWDNRMAQIDYDDVSIDIENYLLGINMFETTSWKAYHYNHNAIESGDRGRNKSNENGWPPKFYVSERGLFGKCWSVDLPYMKGKTIHSFGLIFRNDIFPAGIRPQNYEFGVILHYPNQLSRADVGTYEWKSHEKEGGAPNKYTMRFKIENTLVLRKRNKEKTPCNTDWKHDDDMIYSKLFSKVSCIPPYWKGSNLKNLPNCTRKEQMKEIYHSAITIKTSPEHPPPCQQIEKIIYFFDEFDWLIDDWISKADNSYNNGESNLTKKDSMFEVLLNFLDGTYMEIHHAKAYDRWHLIGNVGGFIGLFLGYSLLHAFLILPKMIKRVYSTIMTKVCPKTTPLKSTNCFIAVDGTKGKWRENFEYSDVFGFDLSGYERKTNNNYNRSMNNTVQKDLMNELIRDNISIKMDLEKILTETRTWKAKFQDIDRRLKDGEEKAINVRVVKYFSSFKSIEIQP